jgi:hypothetical protein
MIGTALEFDGPAGLANTNGQSRKTSANRVFEHRRALEASGRAMRLRKVASTTGSPIADVERRCAG